MGKNLADKVNAALNKRGMTQAELARITGMTTSNVTQLCSGQTKDPRFSTIVKLSLALKMPIDYFVV